MILSNAMIMYMNDKDPGETWGNNEYISIATCCREENENVTPIMGLRYHEQLVFVYNKTQHRML